MSFIDVIKFTIKEVFRIRTTADLPGPPPVLCPRPTGGSQHSTHPSTPATPTSTSRCLSVFLEFLFLCQHKVKFKLINNNTKLYAKYVIRCIYSSKIAIRKLSSMKFNVQGKRVFNFSHQIC